MATLQERIIGSLRLEAKTFEEVEADQSATTQAFIVVVLAAVASGIGSIRAGFGVVGISLVAAIVGWVVWSLLTFVIGTKVLPEKDTHADLGQMLRVLGFAQAPGLFSVLGIIPILGWLVRFAVFVWMLAAVVVAVRQALDYTSTGRAVLVCVIGWVVYMVLMMMFSGMAFFGAAMAR
ncbi:MAG: YIP1 family protein [Vicinamibacterales bacterium]